MVRRKLDQRPGAATPPHLWLTASEDSAAPRYNSRTCSMIFPADIPAIQDELTLRWHEDFSAGAGSGLEALVIQQHRQNFALWHEEDRARSTLASAEEIAQTKRNIDLLNQVRNDLVEALDRELLQQLESKEVKMTGELHS